MKRKIDWSKPYDKVCGSGADHLYEQNHRHFDGQGFEVGGDGNICPSCHRENCPFFMKEDSVIVPVVAQDAVIVTPNQEDDEDIKLEALHDTLTALGVKFHHRAKVETLQKLLDGVLQKRSEEEAA